MSDLDQATIPAGMAADVHIPPIGPLESRRARRERSEAAAASQASTTTSPDANSYEARPARTTVVFSDELAVARQQRLIAIARTERTPVSIQDWRS